MYIYIYIHICIPLIIIYFLGTGVNPYTIPPTFNRCV